MGIERLDLSSDEKYKTAPPAPPVTPPAPPVTPPETPLVTPPLPFGAILCGVAGELMSAVDLGVALR